MSFITGIGIFLGATWKWKTIFKDWDDITTNITRIETPHDYPGKIILTESPRRVWETIYYRIISI